MVSSLSEAFLMARDPGEELAGSLSVEATARRIRWYRYAEERMMRTLAGWIALTPELNAKLLMGRHVWDCAQHADAWGRRLPELRAPAQVSLAPSEAFARFMDRLESPEAWDETVKRLTGVYVVLKPHLVEVYQGHLAGANQVYEPPTRRILERILVEERRHIEEGSRVLAAVAGGAAAQRDLGDAWQAELRALLETAGGVTGNAR
jgi:1,2-phenylacetyl-CoA epoxidase catalytic subunit